MRSLAIAITAFLLAGAACAEPDAPGPPAASHLPARNAIFVESKMRWGYSSYGTAGPFYPERAVRAGASGGAVIRCTLTADGALHDCLLEAEKPLDFAFGAAALLMAKRGAIKAEPRVVDGQPVASEEVLVVVPFQLPKGFKLAP
jgi:TonB family protein